MARFQVYRSRDGQQLLLDCQADRLAHFSTRFVVPLVEAGLIASRVGALHPEVTVEDRRLVLATHLASAVPVAALGPVVAHLLDDDHRIVGALDVLIGTA